MSSAASKRAKVNRLNHSWSRLMYLFNSDFGFRTNLMNGARSQIRYNKKLGR